MEMMRSQVKAQGGELMDFRDDPEDFDDVPERF